MNRPDAAQDALGAIASIPRDDAGPVFPAPWAATAFAMVLLLHERGHFTWPQWADRLGAAIAAQQDNASNDPEAYWLCWLSALEALMSGAGLAADDELEELRRAWRTAASQTPHGEPIELADQVKRSLSR